MPIVVRELVVKATISEGQGQRERSQNTGANKEEIIAECVEQVMELLKEKEER